MTLQPIEGCNFDMKISKRRFRMDKESLTNNDTFSRQGDVNEPVYINSILHHSPFSPVHEIDSNERIKVNVGGVRYTLKVKSILENGCDTKIGRLISLRHAARISVCDYYDEETGEFGFDRLGRNFEPFYDFFMTGKLHVPKNICIEKFMEELFYWQIPQSKLAKCCSPFELDEQDEEDADIDPTDVENEASNDPFEGLLFADQRKKLWRITEGVSQSLGWKLFELTSTTFIVASILSIVLSSMPELMVEKHHTVLLVDNGTSSALTTGPHNNNTNLTKTEVEYVEAPLFAVVEYVCVAYFTIEYVVRLLISPHKSKFVREWLNIVDLFAIMPACFELTLMVCGITSENVSKIKWALLTVRILRVIRMIRVVKLARFSPGVSNFVMTLQRSKGHMQMVAIVLAMVVMFFSTLIYFCEKDVKNTGFRSIPASFWWCIVTMTTVGYGDVVPETTLGKVFGIGAILCGVLVLALPIAIMVTNFMQVVKMNENKRLQKFKEDLNQQHEIDLTEEMYAPGLYGLNMV